MDPIIDAIQNMSIDVTSAMSDMSDDMTTAMERINQDNFNQIKNYAERNIIPELRESGEAEFKAELVVMLISVILLIAYDRWSKWDERKRNR